MLNLNDDSLLSAIKVLGNYIATEKLYKANITSSIFTSKGYFLTKNGNNIEIKYNKKSYFFMAIGSLLANWDEYNFCEQKTMFNERLGIMLDCARNGVPNINFLENFIVVLALNGYNYIGLYIEDCINIDDEPYFGYMRGRYTKEEIKHIDSFAKMFGIEVIPFVQTLAHLNQIFQWPEYENIKDINDILLVEEPRTHKLLENIIKTVRECFSSNNINIGMDEAHMLGLGKYLKKNGYQNKIDIFMKHLNFVTKLCEKYNFQPYMWSDMFFRMAFGDYYADGQTIEQNIENNIPPQITLVYWDYYHNQQSHYEKMIEKHKIISKQTAFAGGLWSWAGFAPFNSLSIQNMFPAIDACRKYQINDIIFTMWGDNGSECSYFALLASCISVAEKCCNDKIDIEQINKKAVMLTGYSFDELMDLDLPNCLYGKAELVEAWNPCKYLFYDDILSSQYSLLTDIKYKKTYHDYYDKINKLAKRKSRYSYLFNTLAKLCHVLEIKSTLAKEVKEAYDKKDKKLLLKLAKSITQLLKRINDFYDAFLFEWNKENKPNGFDIQDFRFGGLLQRLKHTKKVITDYCKGKIPKISELDTERLDVWKKEYHNENNLCVCSNSALKIMSVNNH